MSFVAPRVQAVSAGVPSAPPPPPLPQTGPVGKTDAAVRAAAASAGVTPAAAVGTTGGGPALTPAGQKALLGA